MNNRIYVGVSEGVAESKPGGVIYELDYQLNVLNASPSGELVQAHRDMELAGLVHHSFWSKDGKDLAGRVVTLKRPSVAAVKSMSLQRDQPNTTGIVPPPDDAR